MISLALLFLGTVAVIVAGSGGTTSAIVLDLAFAVLGVISLALSLRAVRLTHYGNAVAWGWCAFPFQGALVLLSLQTLHLSVLLGQVQCDMVCNGPSLIGTIALVLLLGSIVANLLLIRRAVVAQA